MSNFVGDLEQRFDWALENCLESYAVLADGRSFERSDRDERAIPLFEQLRGSVSEIPLAAVQTAEVLRLRAPALFEKAFSYGLRGVGVDENGTGVAVDFVERLNEAVRSELSALNSKHVPELRRLATEFRFAIERCQRVLLPITFADFPRGACGDATLLLAKYLERSGHTGFAYVLGMRAGHSHAWLGRGGLVVDVTADQFEEEAGPVAVDVFSNWHASFSIDPDDQNQPADFEKYDDFTAANLARAYSLITGQMTAPRSAAVLPFSRVRSSV